MNYKYISIVLILANASQLLGMANMKPAVSRIKAAATALHGKLKSKAPATLTSAAKSIAREVESFRGEVDEFVKKDVFTVENKVKDLLKKIDTFKATLNTAEAAASKDAKTYITQTKTSIVVFKAKAESFIEEINK